MMKRNITQSLSTGNAFQLRTTRLQEAKTMLPFGGGTNAEFQKVRPQLGRSGISARWSCCALLIQQTRQWLLSLLI